MTFWVFSKTEEEHVKHVKEVFEILRQQKLYAKLAKCDFGKSELTFLGHVVGAEGVKVDPKKIEVVKEWPDPRDVHNVRQFLGLTNYFRKFIQGYAAICRPISALLCKGEDFAWTTECKIAFQALKEALVCAPVLALPDFSEPFKIFEVICDASGFGIGAVLMQKGRPIAFEGRKMKDAETRYTVGEQELLAVHHALQTWQCYLEGNCPVIVVTDHAPNTWLETQPTLSRRQARWSEFLQRFKLQWQYRPGRQNVADPISRSPAFVAAVQHGRGADVQLALPAPPLDTFETLGEPIKSGYTNDARFQDVGFIEKHGLAKEGDFWYEDEQIAVPESSGLIEQMHAHAA